MSAQPSASERLAKSRERLRQALGQVAAPTLHPPTKATDSPLNPWLNSLKTTPEASFLIDLFQTWWQKQPLGVALTLVAQAASGLLQPTAQRHPYQLVLVAAGMGAVLMLLRPWHWLSTPAVLAAVAAARWVAQPKP